MRMRKVFLLFVTAVLFCSAAYRTQFKDEYEDALNFVRQNNRTIQDEAVRFAVSDTILKVIVFPELTRYSMFRDFFETGGNEFLYVNDGRTMCDFSIGPCQMKPSFAEDVEKIIAASADSAKFKLLTKYIATGGKEIRRERVERLKSLKWQCRYVCAFVAIEKNKLPMGLDDEAQLKFYTSAYNLGLNSSTETIIKWEGIKAFPYGKKYSQFSYTDVAMEYYHCLKQ